MDGAWKSHPQPTNPRVIENKLNAVHPRNVHQTFSGRVFTREICCGHKHHKIYIVTDDGLKGQTEERKGCERTSNPPFNAFQVRKLFVMRIYGFRDFPSWLPFSEISHAFFNHICAENVWLRVIEASRLISIQRRLKSHRKCDGFVNGNIRFFHYSLKFLPRNHCDMMRWHILFGYVYSFISLPSSVSIYFDLCRTMRMHMCVWWKGNGMMHAEFLQRTRNIERSLKPI